MSTATESTLKGKFDQVAGKVKETFGEVTHNDSVANEGTAQQVKGHAEEAWGSVKSAAATTETEHEATAESKSHDLREKIVSSAQSVKEHVQDTLARHNNS